MKPLSSDTIAEVRGTIDCVFTRLGELCARPNGYLHRRPSYAGAWTVAEHLEHVSLANRFLLLTIGKGMGIALRRARSRPVPDGESDLLCLGSVADPSAFPWEPPSHMIPSGDRPVAQVRALLQAQHGECLALLERMGRGEGRLCRFQMSVRDLGKLDMYQWLYFLALHAHWHLEFLKQRDESSDGRA